MILKAYIIMTFLTAVDELWNLCNPRPYPKQKYYTVQWEELDFFEYNGKLILREFRETDNEHKKFIRDFYWEKRNGRSKR
tara:strand:- start:288 stop:527 length:240 start_codon:yes stop_codon:yes gene_type:complete